MFGKNFLILILIESILHSWILILILEILNVESWFLILGFLLESWILLDSWTLDLFLIHLSCSLFFELFVHHLLLSSLSSSKHLWITFTMGVRVFERVKCCRFQNLKFEYIGAGTHRNRLHKYGNRLPESNWWKLVCGASMEAGSLSFNEILSGDFPPWRCSGRQRTRGERRRHPLGNKPWKKEIHYQDEPWIRSLERMLQWRKINRTFSLWDFSFLIELINN